MGKNQIPPGHSEKPADEGGKKSQFVFSFAHFQKGLQTGALLGLMVAGISFLLAVAASVLLMLVVNFYLGTSFSWGQSIVALYSFMFGGGITAHTLVMPISFNYMFVANGLLAAFYLAFRLRAKQAAQKEIYRLSNSSQVLGALVTLPLVVWVGQLLVTALGWMTSSSYGNLRSKALTGPFNSAADKMLGLMQSFANLSANIWYPLLTLILATIIALGLYAYRANFDDIPGFAWLRKHEDLWKPSLYVYGAVATVALVMVMLAFIIWGIYVGSPSVAVSAIVLPLLGFNTALSATPILLGVPLATGGASYGFMNMTKYFGVWCVVGYWILMMVYFIASEQVRGRQRKPIIIAHATVIFTIFGLVTWYTNSGSISAGGIFEYHFGMSITEPLMLLFMSLFLEVGRVYMLPLWPSFGGLILKGSRFQLPGIVNKWMLACRVRGYQPTVYPPKQKRNRR